MAVIVDLHWSSSSPGGSNASREQTPMPNKIQSTLLWTKVAETFKVINNKFVYLPPFFKYLLIDSSQTLLFFLIFLMSLSLTVIHGTPKLLGVVGR